MINRAMILKDEAQTSTRHKYQHIQNKKTQ